MKEIFVFVSKNICALYKTFADVEAAFGEIGLKINQDKIKHVMMSRRNKPATRVKSYK